MERPNCSKAGFFHPPPGGAIPLVCLPLVDCPPALGAVFLWRRGGGFQPIQFVRQPFHFLRIVEQMRGVGTCGDEKERERLARTGAGWIGGRWKLKLGVTVRTKLLRVHSPQGATASACRRWAVTTRRVSMRGIDLSGETLPGLQKALLSGSGQKQDGPDFQKHGFQDACLLADPWQTGVL